MHRSKRREGKPEIVCNIAGSTCDALSSERIHLGSPAPIVQAQITFLLLLRFAICSSLTPVHRCQILSAAILKSMGPRTTMKRGIAVLLSLSVLVTSAYFTASKWAIRHETISFYDPDRNNRLVAVDIAVRRDKEMQANAGLITLAGRNSQPRQYRQEY